MASRRTSPDTQPDVFAFLDVRAYLRAYYDAQKSSGRGFSYRAFSRRVGLASPNHLKRVIDGDRTLTPEMAGRYADAIGLTGSARSYFIDLAAFGRAQTADAREAAYQRLLGYRRVREAHHLEHAQAAYHKHWYLPALRELVTLRHASQDPRWLGAHLLPPVSPTEVKSGLKVLKQLGLLVEDEDGRLVQGKPVVTTGSETRSLHVAAFHRAMMERAADAIDRVPPSERDISSLTFTCSEASLTEVKRRLVAFRRELIALLADGEDEDRVVQLNLQLFPLSVGSEA